MEGRKRLKEFVCKNSALFLIICVVMIVCPLSVRAEVLLSNIVLHPGPKVWVGESVTISCKCETTNGTVERVYALVDHPAVSFFIPLEKSEDLYSNSFIPQHLGTYNITVVCEADESENNVRKEEYLKLTVQRLDINILDVHPDVIYDDSSLEITAEITKTDDSESIITSPRDVSFSYSVNDGDYVIIPSNRIFFDNINRHWVINLPELKMYGSISLTLRVSFENKTVSDKRYIDVFPSSVFRISSITPSEIRGNENITIKLDAFYHDSPILSRIINRVSVRLNNQDIEFQRTGTDEIVIKAPDLAPGSYELIVSVDYTGDVDDDGDNEEIKFSSKKAVSYTHLTLPTKA